MKKFLILIIALFPIVGCSVSRFASVNKNSSFDGYKYVYVVGTNDLSSSAGYASGSQNWLYGASTSKSVNPSDVIAGYLMKKGFARLPQLSEELASKTLIVSYGESGRHPMALGYATEVTVQFIDTSTNEIVATSTAAGIGKAQQ